MSVIHLVLHQYQWHIAAFVNARVANVVVQTLQWEILYGYSQVDHISFIYISLCFSLMNFRATEVLMVFLEVFFLG